MSGVMSPRSSNVGLGYYDPSYELNGLADKNSEFKIKFHPILRLMSSSYMSSQVEISRQLNQMYLLSHQIHPHLRDYWLKAEEDNPKWHEDPVDSDFTVIYRPPCGVWTDNISGRDKFQLKKIIPMNNRKYKYNKMKTIQSFLQPDISDVLLDHFRSGPQWRKFEWVRVPTSPLKCQMRLRKLLWGKVLGISRGL